MQISDVFTAYADEMVQIEAYLDQYISSDIKLIPEVAHHLIDSGGKRFRPLLHLICSRLCGFTGDSRFPLAASIEFIHTASLLHDDVIDEAVIRRGKTSANHVWGNSASVLVGDFLYSKAFTLFSIIGDLEIFRLMSKMTNTMSEGEVFQLMKCGDTNLTEAEYLSIVEKKTAVLISAACESAAVLACAPNEQIQALRQYGYKIGMAFQITDDTLDYMAREEDFGKAIGKDLEEGKMTLPLIYTLAGCSQAERDMIKTTIENKSFSPETIRKIFALIQGSGGIDYSLNCAQTFIRESINDLEVFNQSPAKDHLHAVADYVLSRKQ
ncbi:MAG: octaprenyl diphosphate synthase [Deltaproteobacteria bacterium HGW-Deltaproteobacteria-1]|jgi:octaprenyl-diphosphate synthase|nr:MAG: octaprenyl diphosphate synthase [Deltaproteobacteria bacterium HGW-Deltaproteobacteria-1]